MNDKQQPGPRQVWVCWGCGALHSGKWPFIIGECGRMQAVVGCRRQVDLRQPTPAWCPVLAPTADDPDEQWRPVDHI